MPNLNLSEDEIKNLIAYFKWVDAIDTNQWPPKPVGEAKPREVALKGKPQTLSGKNVYNQYRCDLCHKIGEKGGAIGPDLTHVGSKKDSLWLARQIRDPKSHNPNTQMPPFPQISEGEIQALVDYCRAEINLIYIKGGKKMAYESQKVAIKYFVISAIFFGLQVIVGLLLVSKYIWPDPLIGYSSFQYCPCHSHQSPRRLDDLRIHGRDLLHRSRRIRNRIIQ